MARCRWGRTAQSIECEDKEFEMDTEGDVELGKVERIIMVCGKMAGTTGKGR